jgi:hypothetical protein
LADSCPQCHAAVVPGMRTCQFCGARIEDGEPVAAEHQRSELPAEEPLPEQPEEAPVTAQMQQGEAPDAAAPPNPPGAATAAAAVKPPAQVRAASPGSAKKIKPSTIALIAVGLIGIAIVFLIAWRSLSAISGSGDSGQSTATSTGPVHASELGIDIYPEARALSDGDRSTSPDGSVVSQDFVSGDPMNKVVDFYRTRMTGYASIFADGSAIVVSITRAQESIRVIVSPAQSGGKTRISISRTVSKR